MEYSILQRLNAPSRADRLQALQALAAGAAFPQPDPRMINNHIHTTYSFSPYSPAAAIYGAREAGLCTAGIIDHDSVGGAWEFMEAGKLAGIPTTVGVELRVRFDETPFLHRRTNNPDQDGLSYMLIHGIPHENLSKVQAWFAPLREARNLRNQKMVDRINRLYGPQGVSLDFARDVLPLSMYHDGGTVTERHLMLALARQLLRLQGGPKAQPGTYAAMLEEFDLVGRLKQECIPQVYIDAREECPLLSQCIQFAREMGCILAYSYLGDVTVSVTGDKKAQKFEDDYLDDLFADLADRGIRAIAYAPTRNTDPQLQRLRALCRRYDMLQLSGEDINSPRQSFRTQRMEDPQFANLIQSTWALIQHEQGRDTLGPYL